MIVLGIESSCDETAAALVTDGPRGDRRILADLVAAQLEDTTLKLVQCSSD